MIDLHCHILFGLDDGAQTLEDSLELARALVREGVFAVAATPHVRDDYPTTPQVMQERLETLRLELSRRSVPLDVYPGGEISLDALGRLAPAELSAFGLAGNPGYLLLEFPYYGWPLALPESVARLVRGGVTPVLAHPERNLDVQGDPERLAEVVEAGALVQITAASMTGRFGRQTRRTAHRLVAAGLAHLVSSDAHSPGERLAAIRGARNTVADMAVARWLMSEVPLAILNAQPPPLRPRVEESSWTRMFRRSRRA